MKNIIIALALVNCLHAANYYIDATAGDDANSGIDSTVAWQTLDKVNAQVFNPGDSVLFKSGETWNGQLTPKGSGTIDHPNVISRYGSGDRPIIDGQGAVDYGVLLEDVDYWHVENLEITNLFATEGSRIGVFIHSTGGQRNHLHLKNLYIHDIMGRYSFSMAGKNTGGIGIIGDGESRMDDILIEDSEIGNIVRVGIFTNGNTGSRGDRPITNLVIRNNKIHHTAGDGAIIRYAYRPLIEHNVAYENHNGDEDLVEYGVALWCRSTDEATFQFNEVYNTRGSADGQAFDADLDAYRTVVQYNYTHGNEGGFMLVYGSSSDAIVRYNISVNDGKVGSHLLDFPIWTNPRGSGVFHNNVFFLPAGNSSVIVDEALNTARFYNNIFYSEDGADLEDASQAVFDNNCMFGYSGSDEANDPSGIYGDPQFVDEGSHGIGVTFADGYTLLATSDCLDKGITKDDMGDYWLPDLGGRDFWGNSLTGVMDIGPFSNSGDAPVDSTTPLDTTMTSSSDSENSSSSSELDGTSSADILSVDDQSSTESPIESSASESSSEIDDGESNGDRPSSAQVASILDVSFMQGSALIQLVTITDGSELFIRVPETAESYSLFNVYGERVYYSQLFEEGRAHVPQSVVPGVLLIKFEY